MLSKEYVASAHLILVGDGLTAAEPVLDTLMYVLHEGSIPRMTGYSVVTAVRFEATLPNRTVFNILLHTQLTLQIQRPS